MLHGTQHAHHVTAVSMSLSHLNLSPKSHQGPDLYANHEFPIIK